jgi:aryl-alcohol dehydrogenase-like predicted oxidoreductase
MEGFMAGRSFNPRMKLRTLGRSGLRVSEVGFGAWAIGGNAHGNSYGPTDDATSIAAVRRALDLGCTFFDTADVYGWGHSEEVLGEALRDNRQDVVIATKVGGDYYHGGVRMNFDPGYLAFALDRSLQRLRTDYVDVYQLHNPPLGMTGDPRTYEVLDGLVAENKIRAYGVSVHEPLEAVIAIETGKPAAIQLPFSLFRQEWIDEVLPLAVKRGVGVIAREPLANGFLAGRHGEDARFPEGDIRHHWPPEMIRSQVRAARVAVQALARDGRTPAQSALKFVLAFPEVSVAIPGAKTPAQVEENLAAADARDLTPEEVARCRELHARDFGG